MKLPELIALDRQSIAVWPTLREERLGDWLLRFGGGVYGRSNSVQPFGDPGLPLTEAVANCEERYGAEGLPSMFRLPHLGAWESLDGELESRGYEVNDGALVQVGPVGGTLDESVDLVETPDQEWLNAYFAGSGRGVGREAAVEGLLMRVPTPRAFAVIRLDGCLTALGLGSIHEGTMWMFGIATIPAYRRQGLGRRLCQSLMSWAASEGATRSALQVSTQNDRALRMYEGLGFTTAYEYTYRRKFL